MCNFELIKEIKKLFIYLELIMEIKKLFIKAIKYQTEASQYGKINSTASHWPVRL